MLTTRARILPFKEEHLDEGFPGVSTLPEMTGLTMLRADGVVVMCGGVAPCPWGEEMWVYVREDATRAEKIRVGRIAKGYIEIMLESCGALYAHASPENERWLTWLGFSAFESLFDDDIGEICRWRKESLEEAWV